MRVLVTGGAGQLGRALTAHAPPAVHLHVTQRRTRAAADHVHTVELADASAVDALFAHVEPDLVVHTAYGKADGERDIVAATRSVAGAVARVGASLIHISSDLVFDGEAAPYREGDRLCPIVEYGRWKAAAEVAVADTVADAAIVRTSLMVSADPLDDGNAAVLAALSAGERRPLFVDELRCPIATDDLARQLWELAALPAAERSGPWHLAGPEALSRYALGLLVAAYAGVDAATIRPALQADHPERRPRDLRLSTTRADRALRIRPRPVSALFAPRNAPE